MKEYFEARLAEALQTDNEDEDDNKNEDDDGEDDDDERRGEPRSKK